MQPIRVSPFLLLLLTGLAAACGGAFADEPATVKIDGLRKVLATISADSDKYEVRVRMLPVTTFDTGTNARLNREKARAYALQALSKHLSGGGESQLLVSGARVVESGLQVQEYRLTLAIPRFGVVVELGQAPIKRPTVGTERVQFSETFFTAKRDFLHTLKQLSVGWDVTCRDASDKKDDEFAHAIAQIEEEGLDQLRRLRHEIASQKLLLFTERDELFTAIEDRKAVLLENLREAVRQREAISQFSDIKLEKPFDAYLLAQPQLMVVTGAKIIRLPNGQHAVVGVASTVLKDDSAEDRLRAERVCVSKARAAIVGEVQGVQVAHVEQAKDRTVVVIDNGKETAKSVSELLVQTQTKVEGIARGLAPVGRWKSADGKVFYLAIGGIFDAEGKPVLATIP